jgi:sec-independent protein translocase protein TatB
VVLSILIIGPQDFPKMIKKIGNWIGLIKKYFADIQKDVTDMETSIEDELKIDTETSNLPKDKKKDE